MGKTAPGFVEGWGVPSPQSLTKLTWSFAVPRTVFDESREVVALAGPAFAGPYTCPRFGLEGRTLPSLYRKD